MARTLRELWTALLPRLGAAEDTVTVLHQLALPGHDAGHGIRLRPAERTVEVGDPVPGVSLSLRQDTAGYVDLFQAVFGGRLELGAGVFGGTGGALARRLAASFADRPCLRELADRQGSCK